jgi:hypothetical protein
MAGGSTGAPNLARKPFATRLTQEELKQRSAKGLCWHCDEKWHRGHQCKQGRLLMIEPVEEPALSEVDSGESDSDDGESGKFRRSDGSYRSCISWLLQPANNEG